MRAAETTSYQQAPHSPRSAAPGASQVPGRLWLRAAGVLAGLGLSDAPDGCSGPDRLRNLGYLVHHGEQLREPTGRGIRADLDGVVDTGGLPGCNVEPARRGHADPVQFDVQCLYGPWGMTGRGCGPLGCGHGTGPGGHGVVDRPDADRVGLVSAGGGLAGEAAALLRAAVRPGGGGCHLLCAAV